MLRSPAEQMKDGKVWSCVSLWPERTLDSCQSNWVPAWRMSLPLYSLLETQITDCVRILHRAIWALSPNSSENCSPFFPHLAETLTYEGSQQLLKCIRPLKFKCRSPKVLEVWPLV